jgi:hypothetical protein
MTNDPERRIQAVEGLLTRSIDGGPGFLIDGTECPHFTNAMEWGFRYKKSASGMSDNKVEKNFHSHVGDAGQYLSLHYNAQILGLGPQKAAKREVVSSGYLYV